MSKSFYNQQILNKIEKSINIFLPIGSIVALLGAWFVHYTQRSPIISLVDIGLAITLLILFVIRHQISPNLKIGVLTTLVFSLGLLSLLLSGLNGVGLFLFILSSILVTGFFSNKISIIYSIIKTISLIMLVYFINQGIITFTGLYQNLSNNTNEWILPILLLTLIDWVLIIVINAIKNHLIESIMDSENHLEKITRLAYYDQLTSLPNKDKFFDTYGTQNKENAILLQFSIEGLSMINNIYGNDEGDQVILKIASYLKKHTQTPNQIARLSGSEFIWLFIQTEINVALSKYNGLLESLKCYELSCHSRHMITFSASYIHHSKISFNTETISSLYKKTCIALEQAKLHKVTEPLPYNQESEKEFLQQEHLKTLLTAAIREEKITLHYQEKINTQNGEITGVEALARWHCTGIGNISPGTFIPLVKKLNMTLDFDLMITEQVFQEFNLIVQKYHTHISVSINISPLSLVSKDFIDQVKQLSQLYSINPNQIYFELTEDAFIENFDQANHAIENLKDLGYKISIDDFGSGYTAMNYIFKLKFDELKMDRSFVTQLAQDPKNIALLQTIINLKDIYSFTIVAEGVETQSQCDLLQKLGCWHIQGFLYSRPSPILCPSTSETTTSIIQ